MIEHPLDAILRPTPPVRPLHGKLTRLDDDLWFVALDGCGHTIGPGPIAEVEHETGEHANDGLHPPHLTLP